MLGTDTQGRNVSTTPITAMGCRQCLPLSVVQLKGKHCWKPHCRNGARSGITNEVLVQPSPAVYMKKRWHQYIKVYLFQKITFLSPFFQLFIVLGIYNLPVSTTRPVTDIWSFVFSLFCCSLTIFDSVVDFFVVFLMSSSSHLITATN